MSDSAKTASPVVVTPEGDAATATPIKGGGLVLSPLPLNGGRRKSKKGSKKSRKISKKALKAIKKIGGEEVVEAVEKAMAGAEPAVAEEVAVAEEAVVAEPTEGARRRKSKKAGKKGGRKSRKSIY
jgi:hypothetical protein